MSTPDAHDLLRRLPAGLAFSVAGGPSLSLAERPVATVIYRTEAVLRSLLASPSLLRFGEAFVAGDLDVEGDLEAAVACGYAADAWAVPPPPVVPRPLDEEAIPFHYDVSNEFFALFLDPRMVYTCGYFADPALDLEDAQAAKLDLVCRKLRLARGQRLLDVGCGWGGLMAWAAGRYDAEVLGITLSPAQVDYATAMLSAAGLDHRTRVALCHHRDVRGEACFDRIAAVGAIEHVGADHYGAFFGRLHALLRPGGLVLNHGITHASPGTHSSGMAFLARYVFPGMHLPSLGTVVTAMERAALRVVDVEALGGHYALTTRAWRRRLEANAARARVLVGERIYRTWIAYLAAATVAFESGWIDLHQIVATRPEPGVPVAATTRGDHRDD